MANFSFPKLSILKTSKCLVGTKFGRASYQGWDLRREQGTRDYLPPLHPRDTRHASVFAPKLDFSLHPQQYLSFLLLRICQFSKCIPCPRGCFGCLEGPPTLGVGTPAFQAEHLYYFCYIQSIHVPYPLKHCFTFGESASACSSEPQVQADKAIS